MSIIHPSYYHYLDNTDLDNFDINFLLFRNRMQQLKEKNMNTIPKNLKKRYYVGSLSVFGPNNPHLKATVNEAIADAKQKLDETGDDQFVVQIIRVVRKQAIPILVEKV